MNKYGLHGSLKAKLGKGQELSSILVEASKIVSQAKGCISYVVGLDTKDKDLIWVSEIWESKEDHDASLTQENVRTLIGKAMPLLAEMPTEGNEYSVISETLLTR